MSHRGDVGPNVTCYMLKTISIRGLKPRDGSDICCHVATLQHSNANAMLVWDWIHHHCGECEKNSFRFNGDEIFR